MSLFDYLGISLKSWLNRKKVQTLIKLLLKEEQFDPVLHCLHLLHFPTIYGKYNNHICFINVVIICMLTLNLTSQYSWAINFILFCVILLYSILFSCILLLNSFRRAQLPETYISLDPLRKHAYSNILKILQSKKENFQIKNSNIFHFSAQNIDCGYSLELPQRGGSNKYPQSMFFLAK